MPCRSLRTPRTIGTDTADRLSAAAGTQPPSSSRQRRDVPRVDRSVWRAWASRVLNEPADGRGEPATRVEAHHRSYNRNEQHRVTLRPPSAYCVPCLAIQSRAADIY